MSKPNLEVRFRNELTLNDPEGSLTISGDALGHLMDGGMGRQERGGCTEWASVVFSLFGMLMKVDIESDRLSEAAIPRSRGLWRNTNSRVGRLTIWAVTALWSRESVVRR